METEVPMKRVAGSFIFLSDNYERYLPVGG